MPIKLHLTTGETFEMAQEQSVLDALKEHDVFLLASCGGKGTCGKCKVRVVHGDAGSSGFGKLTQREREHGIALACTCRPAGDLTIEIPQSSRMVVGDKIAMQKASQVKELFESFGVGVSPVLSTIELHLPEPNLNDNISDMERLRRALAEHGLEEIRFSHGFTSTMAHALRRPQWKVHLGYYEDHCAREAVFISPHDDLNRYGLAIDIGTTTVVVYLVDMHTGGILDMGSTYNSQIRHGDDVITRIVHATERPGGLGELRAAVTGDINNLLRVMLDKHKIKGDDVECVTVAGNTTMSQLFWGLDPGFIREEPYIPTLNSFPLWAAGVSRVAVNPQAPVYTFPCVASYVGGDIVAGVLASKINRSEQITLFMDIGTNGEIALGSSDWIVTAACSAGPCFEGSGIRHGMRATNGAIEGIKIDRATLEPELKVIGGGRPVGICGSGMIDAIAEMFITGVIDQKGSFVEGKSKRVRACEEGTEYVFFEDEEGYVSLTGVDIENILRAKAAIYAGVSLMVAEMGLTMDAIERVFIAGGFGNYLNVERAITLGMLPDLPLDKFKYLGNTSVAGAYLALMSRELREEAEAIASKMTYIELSVSRGFMDEYMSAMFLPHTDMSQFPTVQKMMDVKGK